MLDDLNEQDLKKINWSTLSASRDLYLNIIFHTLTLPELERFATLSKSETERKFCRQLVDDYYKKCSVFSTPGEDHDGSSGPYQYDSITEPHLTYLKELAKNGKDFNPKEINLDYFKLIGRAPDFIVFNPLLYLHQCGNQVLLDRIYQHALEHYKSHQSFGFHTDAPITDYLTTEQELDNFVKAQWAICTYQSPEIFDEHFRNMGVLDDRKKYAVHEKLLNYAFDTKNSVMVNHLCLHADYELLGEVSSMELTLPVKRAIETGLDINAAFVLACTKKYFNIETLVLLYKAGANPLHALEKPEGVTKNNIGRLSRNMLWFHHKRQPEKIETPEKIEALKKQFIS